MVTNGDRELAEKYRDELLDRAWEQREAFVYHIDPLSESLARAKTLTEGPVVLLDHYDNSASGGAGHDDGAGRHHRGRARERGRLRDPRSRGSAGDDQGRDRRDGHAALGRQYDMPSIKTKGEPLTVTGRVKLISDGRYRNLGPASKGVLMDMGPTVVLDTGKVEIVVISRHQEPNDLNCFLSLGIDPTRKNYLMLKSRVHWRAGFAPIIKHTVECAGTGVCTSDYSVLDFQHVRRPVFPLDRINEA